LLTADVCGLGHFALGKNPVTNTFMDN